MGDDGSVIQDLQKGVERIDANLERIRNRIIELGDELATAKQSLNVSEARREDYLRALAVLEGDAGKAAGVGEVQVFTR